jgi:hypothetical protein
MFCYVIAKGDKMLEYLRNAADKPVAKILMWILIFSFVGWGVAEWVFGLTSSDTTIMRIGGEKISINQYTSVKSNELSKLSRDEQRTIYTDPNAMTAFQGRVVKSLSAMKQTELHARDLGYVVSDHYVAKQIRNIPQFQENGKFSTAAFDVVLRNSGLTEMDIINDFRMQKLYEMAVTPASTVINTPKFAVQAVYNARGASRTLDLATVKFSDFKVKTPTDQELAEFYKQNPHRIAETRDVSYVMVNAEMDKPDEYERGLKIAQKLEDDIIAGDELVDAAKKHNATYTHHNKISTTKLPDDKNITDAILARIFAMDEGTESELIETKKGFVIVRVDKITPEHNAEFETVKKELVSEWTRAEQRKAAYVRANELLVDLNKTGKLSNGKSVNVSRTDGAATPVLVAAFHKNIGDNAIVDGDNEFYVMHVAGEKLPTADDKKMATLKDEVSKLSAQRTKADFDSYLNRKYPVKINEKIYNRFAK